MALPAASVGFGFVAGVLSSKLMNTPGSLNFTAPFTRNVMANRVLPQPAAPQTSDGRPAGKPPSVTSSKPVIPVGAFNSMVGVVVSSGITGLVLNELDGSASAKPRSGKRRMLP